MKPSYGRESPGATQAGPFQVSTLDSRPRRMDTARIARVSDRLNAALSPQSWLVAIFHNGSTVAGTDQSGSDVDFTIIVRRSKDRGRVLQVLKHRFGYRYLGLDHGTLSFRDRRKVGITVVDRPTVDRWLRRLYRGPEDLLALQGVVQHKIVEATSIYDPQGLLAKYQQRVNAYPIRIQKAVFSQATKSLETVYENWGSRNEFHFAAELPSLLENICIALYALNRRLFMVPYKRLHVDLTTLRPNIQVELYRLVRSGRSARSRTEGRKVLQTILRKLRIAMSAQTGG